MSEIRVQVAFHFKTDPAQLTPGVIRLPEQITRTISVGSEFTTEKVVLDCLPAADRAALVIEIEKQTREMTRTAKPAGACGAVMTAAAEETEEMSAF